MSYSQFLKTAREISIRYACACAQANNIALAQYQLWAQRAQYEGGI